MPSELSIAELIEHVVAFRDMRGWREAHSPESLAKSITIEASELLELFQWHPPQLEELRQDTPLRERVSEELADVLIYALSMADRLELDVAQIIHEKLEKNARKYPLPAEAIEQ